MNPNYSYQTSLPAYKENPSHKLRQSDNILAMIKMGADNLLKLSQASGILQAVVSARVNELINEGKITYDGFTTYNNRKRKRIVTVKILTQKSLF